MRGCSFFLESYKLSKASSGSLVSYIIYRSYTKLVIYLNLAKKVFNNNLHLLHLVLMAHRSSLTPACSKLVIHTSI